MLGLAGQHFSLLRQKRFKDEAVGRNFSAKTKRRRKARNLRRVFL
jgi:hypothetical protein